MVSQREGKECLTSDIRHKKLSTTMELYTHSVGSKQCEAQQKYLSAIGLNLVTGKTTGNEGQKQTA
jgi:hypothetical protein